MLHRKLSLRRWACVPWLLVVGLVLGWSGEAVADPSSVTGHGKPDATHTHATDPYLVLNYKVVRSETDGTLLDDMLFVSWSDSFSKNYNSGSGTAATTYEVSLFKGEIPADPANPDPSDTDDDQDDATLTVPVNSTGHSDGSRFLLFSGVLADDRNNIGSYVGVRSDTLLFALGTGTSSANNLDNTALADFYWVRMKVTVADGDDTQSARLEQSISLSR